MKFSNNFWYVKAFENGEMLSGEIKQVMVDCVWEFVERYQQSRANITDEVVAQFFATHPRV